MKDKKSRIKLKLDDIFVIVFFFGVIIFIVQSKKSMVKQIEANKMYSIATIVLYKEANFTLVPRGATIHSGSSLHITFFDHMTNSETYAVVVLGGTPSNPAEQIGKQFMVVYDYKKPKNCILLEDCPVRDSTDYIRYIEKFKNNPPNIDKYSKCRQKRRTINKKNKIEN